MGYLLETATLKKGERKNSCWPSFAPLDVIMPQISFPIERTNNLDFWMVILRCCFINLLLLIGYLCSGKGFLHRDFGTASTA